MKNIVMLIAEEDGKAKDEDTDEDDDDDDFDDDEPKTKMMHTTRTNQVTTCIHAQ